MAALVQEMEAQRARKQSRSRRMHAEEQENVPAANMHEHAATTAGPLGAAGETESWRERQARRQAQFKPQPAPEGNAERVEARRKAERGRDMPRASWDLFFRSDLKVRSRDLKNRSDLKVRSGT